MNGLIISHKDHTNGSAPLRSLPVITSNCFASHFNQTVHMAVLECTVTHELMLVKISALKQNGLLQTLAAGGDQAKPAGDSLIPSHGYSFVSPPPPSLRNWGVYPGYQVAVAGKISLRTADDTGLQRQ